MQTEIIQFVDPDVIKDKLKNSKDPLKLLTRWEQEAIDQGWDIQYYITLRINHKTQTIRNPSCQAQTEKSPSALERLHKLFPKLRR